MNTDIEKIAVLTRKYESNGDPAYISSGVGDVGGISYGLYQFASKIGTVDRFVNWLKNYPIKAYANYGEILASHAVNSDKFKADWHDLGTVDPITFGRLQDEYIKIQYIEPVTRLLAKENYHLDKHSNAMKAVVLSRSVQNGPTGCTNIFRIAVEKLGHPNLSYVDDSYFDRDLINAVYDFLIVECDLARPSGDGIWHSPDDFCHGSKHVMLALRRRFISERNDALSMLNE